MQIFILDNDIKNNARYYVDRHVCKIQTEIAQCLCTVFRNLISKEDLPNFIYKSTHEKHPCILWLKESRQNFKYGIELGLALHEEYNFRYPKNGKYKKEFTIFNYFNIIYKELKFEKEHLTPFAQAVPSQYKNDNVVKAYRDYYNTEKRHLFKWSNRNKPEWINL